MRLLLIEDEEKVSRLIVRGLTAERFAVDAAADGRSGLELTQAYTYDLIILDLMLPGLNGTEVLRQVRLKNTNVPVLVLTARDALDDKVTHFELGVDVYVRHLRNKIDEARERKLIRTVRGVGYVISDEEGV
jgi:two-component system copper resistance phosphate regulon response regulator CusR